jgi:LAO/AO transport system kinase
MLDKKKILSGDKSSLARAISLVENNDNKSTGLLSSLYPHLGKAHRIGITGPPGVGKSTLVDELAINLRKLNKTVGIIAIDPTSIFSGGAILGDRIRMQKIGIDDGVFIRSMATRGWIGGISRSTSDAADIIDASGKSYVIIETVGVGQSEIEIFKNVDTTILVLSPESGDAIQAMKAGIMEIADVIVMNKSDRSGADSLIDAIRNTCEMQWSPPNKASGGGISLSCRKTAVSSDVCRNTIPIFKTEAVNSVGITEVLDYLEKRWQHLKESGELSGKRKLIVREKLKSLVFKEVEDFIGSNKKVRALIDKSVDKILSGKTNIYKSVGVIIKEISGIPKRR